MKSGRWEDVRKERHEERSDGNGIEEIITVKGVGKEDNKRRRNRKNVNDNS